MSKLLGYVKYGWPKNDVMCTEYSHVKNDLSIHNEVVLFRNRIVVPAKIRPNILNMLHAGHNGIVAMKADARKNLWWPNISTDIEEKAKSCNTCSINNRKPLQSKLTWPEPGKTWSRLHIDYCGPIDNHYFLIIIDAKSKFMDVHACKVMNSRVTIECLRRTFANFGVPHEIVSDNAAYFVSEEIRKFYSQNNIELKNSAPFHAASNGQAERAVQTFKNGMRKFSTGSINTRVCRFLYNYRRTVQSGTKLSPDQALFNRNFRSPLDIVVQNKGERERVKMQSGPERYTVGVNIFAKNYGRGEQWLPGVVEEVKGRRNFVVKVFGDFGTMLWRRHSDQMKLRFNVSNSTDIEDSVDEPVCDPVLPPLEVSTPLVLQPVEVPSAASVPAEAVALPPPAVLTDKVPRKPQGTSGRTKPAGVEPIGKPQELAPPEPPPTVVTRSGREVKKPHRYVI